MTSRTRLIALLVVLGALLGLIVFRSYVRPLVAPLIYRALGEYSVDDRLSEFGDAARARMAAGFAEAGVAYPPARVTLMAVKADKTLHVYAGDSEDSLHHVLRYPVLGQSGTLGPKLREGDLQVPEGRYEIETLNPNSRFYVSLRLNYPNAWDWEKARADGRENPGSDIYIHGKRASIGCLAMGDQVAEELFCLVADVGKENVTVLIAPIDFRATDSDSSDLPDSPPWIGELYRELRVAQQNLPL